MVSVFGIVNMVLGINFMWVLGPDIILSRAHAGTLPGFGRGQESSGAG